MIQNTFSILQGIGDKLEGRLWAQGIRSWDQFLAAADIDFISPEKKRLYDAQLLHAAARLAAGDADFFARALRGRQHWRMYPHFREYAVALDIETNGLGPAAGGYTTLVGLFDGFDYTALVCGQGLSREKLERELARYRYLITFFGSGFDIPFLRQTLGVRFGMPHFDLCFAGRRAGLKGGLKRLEEQFSIQRDEAVRGLGGYDAVKLWHAAEAGSAEALELLITYNRCDTVNLFDLADRIYALLREQSGLDAAAKFGLSDKQQNLR